MLNQRPSCPSTGFSIRGTVATCLAVAGLLATPAVGQITGFEESPISVVLSRAGVSQTGECTGRLDPGSGSLQMVCSHDLGGGAAVRLRRGTATGPIVATLGGGSPAVVDYSLSDVETASLITGELFLQITSGAGTVSSHFLPRPPIGAQVMRFPLRQDSLVFSGSDATGSCALRIGSDQQDFRLLCRHDVVAPTQVMTMKDGGIVSTHAVSGNPIEVSLPALGQDYDSFLIGHFGVILASAAHPAGEIAMVLDRCRVGPNILCLNGERFQVTVDFAAPGNPLASAGAARPRSSDSGLFWFFGPDNWEVAVKVISGCGMNQRYWVFLSANTNVRFDVRVYDTITGRSWAHTNPQGTLAGPVADTAAFPCS